MARKEEKVFSFLLESGNRTLRSYLTALGTHPSPFPPVLAPLPGGCVQVMNQFRVTQVQRMLLHFFFFSFCLLCDPPNDKSCRSQVLFHLLLAVTLASFMYCRLPDSDFPIRVQGSNLCPPLCHIHFHVALICLLFTCSCSANTAFIKKVLFLLQ